MKLQCLRLLVGLVVSLVAADVAAQEAVIISPPKSVCEDKVMLAAKDLPVGWTGRWSSPMSNVTFKDQDSYTTIVSGLQHGENVVFWTVMDPDGNKYETHTIIRNDAIDDIRITSAEGDNACYDKCYLSGYVSGDYNSCFWTSVANNNIFFENSDKSQTAAYNLAYGENVFVWTVTRGDCSFSKDIIVRNTPVNAKITDATTTYTCDGKGKLVAESLEKSPGAVGYWTCSDPDIKIDSPSDYSTSFYGLYAGSATFRWNVYNGACTSDADVRVVRERSYESVLNNAEEYVCDGEVTLLASDYGEWTCEYNDVFIEGPTMRKTVARNLKQGENLFKWIIGSEQCRKVQYVKVYNTPVKAVVSKMNTTMGVCRHPGRLEAEAPDAGAYGYWTPLTIGPQVEVSSSNITIFTNTGTGVNTFRWTVTNKACESYEDVDIIDGYIKSAIFNNDGEVVCENFCSLSGNFPFNATVGFWTSDNPDVVFDNKYEKNTIARNLAKGPNKFTWEVSSDVCSDQSYVTVFYYPVEAYIDEKATTTITCNGSGDLVAGKLNDNATGYWVTSDPYVRIKDHTNPSTTFEGAYDRFTNFKWIVKSEDGGCLEYAEVNVTNEGQNAIVANDDVEYVCDDNCYLYASMPPYSAGEWTCANPDVYIEMPTWIKTVAKNLSVGENRFKWTVGFDNCKDVREIVVFNNSVKASISDKSTTVTCDGSGTLSADLENGAEGYWTVFNDRVVFGSQTMSNTTFSCAPRGVTTFRWTVKNGSCSAYAEIDVENKALDAIIFNEDNEIVCGDECKVSAYLPDGALGRWEAESPGITFDDPTLATTTVRNLSKGYNSIKWIVNNQECEAMKLHTIINNSVTAKVLNTDGEVVDGTECQLKSELSDNAKGYWSTCNSQIVIERASDNICTVKNLAEGDNCFVWTAISEDGKCMDTSDLKIVSKQDGNNTHTPIAEVIANPNIAIWAYDKTIVVENPGNEIKISDTNGRVIKTVTPDSDRAEIPMRESGIFLVKTAGKSQKIVIR